MKLLFRLKGYVPGFQTMFTLQSVGLLEHGEETLKEKCALFIVKGEVLP